MPAAVLLRNNVRVSGQGDQALVFAHGFGGDQTMWRFVAPAFEATHKVVLFDTVGAGRSDARTYDATRYSSLQGYASDVLEILEALDLQQVIFVGHSASAMAGILASLRRPSRFARLVVVGASPSYLNDAPHYLGGFEPHTVAQLLDMMQQHDTGWASALARIMTGNHELPEHAAELEAILSATDPVIARHFAETMFLSDHRDDVTRVTTPSLVVQCAQDPIAPTPVGEWMSRYMPNSTFQALTATGHCPQLTHPNELVQVIRADLNAPAGIKSLKAA
jgi:sigma-B regulation protein RsbQ